MAAQSWYRVGTAALTNASTAVTGTSTAWTAQAKSGDMITFDGGGTWYEIASIDSNTSITLATAYAGSTASGVAYAINRTSPLWTLASELATRVAALLDSINLGLIAWHTVSGAPLSTLGSDGDYAIDPAASMVYGPKAAGAWPSGISLVGAAGADGVDGADGTDGVSAGLTFTFKTSTTMGDPGDGALRLNNATLASVTAIAIDDQSAASGTPSVKALILTWDDSTSPVKGTLTIKKRGADGTFAVYRITAAITDNTEWLQLTVTHVASAGTFSADDVVTVEFVANGDAGSVGSAPTISDATLASTLKVTGDLTPSQITADQNDYNPSGLSTAIVLRLSTDSNGGAGRSVTGLSGGVGGRLVVIDNVGANPLTLKDESASSTAANRFNISTDVTIAADRSAVLRYDATAGRWRMVAGPSAGGGLTSGTSVASTSGTEVAFTGLPAGVKHIVIAVHDMSLNSADFPVFQIGDSGGYETSGYLMSSTYMTASAIVSANYTDGFKIRAGNASNKFGGSIDLYLVDEATNAWSGAGVFATSNAPANYAVTGSKALSAPLDRIRLTSDGAGTFDSGVVQIFWE